MKNGSNSVAQYGGWSPPSSAGEALRCSVLRGPAASAVTEPPWIVKAPLHSLKPNAKIAITVQAGGKADDSNACKSRLIGLSGALLFAFGMLIPAHAESLKMLQADESYDGRTVKLAVGESLEISLPENPTTGYVWQVPIAAKETVKDAAADDAKQAENSPCRYVKDFYEPGHTEVAGQGGIHHRQYVAVKSGTCQIDLVYRRVWDKDVAPKRTFRLQVEVRKGD